MKYYLLTAAAVGILLGGVAVAQVAPTRNTTTRDSNGTSSVAKEPSGTVAQSAANASKAASINGNPAVATSSANDMQPAKGANSFTMAEARSRLERNGYSSVSNLTKDANGVWRGQAMKGGSQENVWLDYKGNTGSGK